MLEKLRSYFASSDLSDDPFIRLDSFVIDNEDSILTMSVKDYNGPDTWSQWTVEARAMRQYRITEPHGNLCLYEDGHVLARQYTDTWQDLYYRGVPQSPAGVVGRLLIAHTAIAGTWIPFEQYLNINGKIEDFLTGGFGRLADGPSFLIEAYANVLQSEGMKPNALAPRVAKKWNGERWIDSKTPLATLVIGNSFFVAEMFEER